MFQSQLSDKLSPVGPDSALWDAIPVGCALLNYKGSQKGDFLVSCKTTSSEFSGFTPMLFQTVKLLIVFFFGD